jgi:hypothetical protein
MRDDDAITPAERGYTDAAPAKEKLFLSLPRVPREVRSPWADALCLLGALFGPVLTTSGVLVLGWSIFGWGPTDLALLAGTSGVSLGACCLWPLLRVPPGAHVVRLALLGVYMVAVSLVVSFICRMFVVFDGLSSNWG